MALVGVCGAAGRRPAGCGRPGLASMGAGRRQGMALLVAMALAFGLCGCAPRSFWIMRCNPLWRARPAGHRRDCRHAAGARIRLAPAAGRGVGAQRWRPVDLPPLVDLAWYAGAAGDAAQTPPAVHAGERWRRRACGSRPTWRAQSTWL